MNKDYLNRILSGFVYITLFFVSIFSGNIYLNLFLLIIVIIGLYEFANIMGCKGVYRWIILYFLSLLIFVSNYLTIVHMEIFIDLRYVIFFLLLLSIFVYFILEVFKGDSDFVKNIGGMLMPILILVLPLCLLTQISFLQGDYNPYIVFYFVLSICVNDTFAFLSGRFFGKTKVFKKISPQKTLEGYIGAWVFTFLFSWSFYSLFADHGNLLNKFYVWFGIFLIVAIFGAIGDLVESKFKRKAKVKDSGNIIVGHGGVLDRLDSMLFSIPFFYIFIKIIY